jgi:uncharacterized protein YecE (DUF72 family)
VRADSVRRPLPVPPRTASWSYQRNHDGAGPRGTYSERQLRELVKVVGDGREGFVYFNNDWEGFAVENARGLLELLQRTPSERSRSD